MIVLVVVVAVIGIAAILLAKTVSEAQAINSKAQNIAQNGRGINTSTDSVVQLTRTNKLAESILNSATPLRGQLAGIVGTARNIDGLAGSINGTAGNINGTAGAINVSAGRINQFAGAINAAAGRINSSAGSINSTAANINGSATSINGSAGSINTSAGSVNRSVGSINTSAQRIDGLAASILPTARDIHRDVFLINANLDVTLRLVNAIKADTNANTGILKQAVGAHDTATCIDKKLFGTAGNDGDCQGQVTPAAARTGAGLRSSGKQSSSAGGSPEDLQKLLRDAAPVPAPPPGAPGAAPGQLPNIPGLPELPEIPTLPTVELPKLPRVPELPKLPKLPKLPALPKVPGLPDLPALDENLTQKELEELLNRLGL